MGATFGSFNSALSALRYHQVVMDVSGGNIANASTDGYARRRVMGEAVGAPAQPARYSRYDESGLGVRVGELQRMTDPLLDARARREHANQSFLDTRYAVLARFESGIGEPGENGVSASLAEFRSAWHDLANNPGSEAARSQVLARANTLAESFAAQSRNVSAEAESQRYALLSVESEVRTLAADLGQVNESIAIAKMNGTDAGVLLDQRDALAMRLSELTGARGQVNAQGGMDVSFQDASGTVTPLVSGKQVSQFAIATGVRADGTADGNPVTFSVTPPGGAAAAATPSGEAGAITELLNLTLPGYATALNEVAKKLADDVNAVHGTGYDQDGNTGSALFTYDPAAPNGPLTVALTNPRSVAASGVGATGGDLDGSNASKLAGALGGAEGVYQRLVNGFGTEVASVKRLALNQQTLTNQVDGAREQLSGVSLDEEMVTMVQAQRAYEAAARLMTTLDSVLDTLINRTGLVR
ncbi:flagellar hook-associated protein FlgK [Nocardioides sp. GCM10027113]|uniref:flagellar hook-associated protein FlgK n=1 Tax=unclassified Nocardioides TaxID=2615069 RepID=UPI003606D7F8